jgi:hypothetical protein
MKDLNDFIVDDTRNWITKNWITDVTN